MKKVNCILLALVFVFLLCACGSTVESPTPSEDEQTTVRVTLTADPGSLGPYVANNAGRHQLLNCVYECLADYDAAGDLHLYIAKDYTVVDDVTVDVEIWDNVYDSDGNHITADDVVFSYMNDESLAMNYMGTYIENVTKLDNYHVQIKLNTAEVKANERSMTFVRIVSQKAYEESGDGMASRAVGTGPYVITDYVEGSSVIEERRDDYWKDNNDVELSLQEKHNVDRMEFNVVTEAAQQVIALETDMTDIVHGMGISQALRFADNPDYNVITTNNTQGYTLFFNHSEDSACRDLAVRQAICYAIDSQGIIDSVFEGYADKAFAYGSGDFPDILNEWDDGNYYEYNPTKAVELLKNAGYQDGDITIRLLLRSTETDQNIGLLIQGYLEAVDINCTLAVYEESLAKTYAKDFTTWDVYLRLCGSNSYMFAQYSSDFISFGGGTGYNGVIDEEFRSLINACKDPATYSEEALTKVHDYMTDNVCAIGICYPRVFTVAKSSVVTDAALNVNMWLVPSACTYVWNK